MIGLKIILEVKLMDKLSYEDASKELNAIVKRVEDGDASVSETVELLERGKVLLTICYKELDKANGKLVELTEIMGKLEEV